MGIAIRTSGKMWLPFLCYVTKTTRLQKRVQFRFAVDFDPVFLQQLRRHAVAGNDGVRERTVVNFTAAAGGGALLGSGGNALRRSNRACPAIS